MSGDYWPRGPWNKTARQHEHEPDAHIYGWDDPLLQHSPETLEGQMAKYVASFPPSHWRLAHGTVTTTVVVGPYKKVHQDTKQAGMMVFEPHAQYPSSNWKFNVVMKRQDPKANIEAIAAALHINPLLAIGSCGRQLTFNTQKTKGNHASEYDVIFRTMKMRT